MEVFNIMQSHRSSIFLRRVLAADALTCFASGLLLVFAADVLEQDVGLPTSLLRYAGISLIPLAAFLVYLARREALSQSMVWTVIVLNLLWTAGSFLLLLTGWAAPTGFGLRVHHRPGDGRGRVCRFGVRWIETVSSG